MQQVIIPSGAPYLTPNKKWNKRYECKDVQPQKYIDNIMGYILVTVEGDDATVDFFATRDGATATVDSLGKTHYQYNDKWESWKFTKKDSFKYKLN